MGLALLGWSDGKGSGRGCVTHANLNPLRRLHLQTTNHNSRSILNSFSTLPSILLFTHPKSTLTITVVTLCALAITISYFLFKSSLQWESTPQNTVCHETQSFTMSNSGHIEGGRVTKTLSRQGKKAPARKALGSAQINSKSTSYGTRTIRLTSFRSV